MTRTPVKSSNLKSVGYDPAAQHLEVEFNNGSVHRYENIPPHHHQSLLNADSPGSYLHAHIKGKFGSTKITG